MHCVWRVVVVVYRVWRSPDLAQAQPFLNLLEVIRRVLLGYRIPKVRKGVGVLL